MNSQVSLWGAWAASPPQDGFAVVNLLISAASRNNEVNLSSIISRL